MVTPVHQNTEAPQFISPELGFALTSLAAQSDIETEFVGDIGTPPPSFGASSISGTQTHAVKDDRSVKARQNLQLSFVFIPCSHNT
jgi:hypothetical protein